MKRSELTKLRRREYLKKHRSNRTKSKKAIEYENRVYEKFFWELVLPKGFQFRIFSNYTP